MTVDEYNAYPGKLADKPDGDFSELIRRYLVLAMKTDSRVNIAFMMSARLGQEGAVTKSMLDKWTRKKDGYRFPLEYLPALCDVTGDYRLIYLLMEETGGIALYGADKTRYKLERAERLKAAAEEEIQRLNAQLTRTNKK